MKQMKKKKKKKKQNYRLKSNKAKKIKYHKVKELSANCSMIIQPITYAGHTPTYIMQKGSNKYKGLALFSFSFLKHTCHSK
jgi:ABC-type uncharacterized transport system ATPase subunit